MQKNGWLTSLLYWLTGFTKMSPKTEDKRYFVVFKMEPKSRASSYGFTAGNTGLAMRELLRISGVESTATLHEFDLMEVLDDGRYRMIAQRYPPSETSKAGTTYESGPKQTEIWDADKKQMVPVSVTNPLPTTSHGKPPWKEEDTGESKYKPYNIATA